MRSEPLEKPEETEEIFSVTDWTVAGILIEKLHEQFPKYDFLRRESSGDKFVSVRVYSGLNDAEFNKLSGFAEGYFFAIKHLFPNAICIVVVQS